MRNAGTQLAFSFLFSSGSPRCGMVSPTFIMGLLISSNLIWKIHCRCARKFVLMMSLNPIKLTRINLTVSMPV